ncbi:FtsK/SpoIIIE domain-containing protein [Mangrovactinospora gilvigrisea]|uniref:FtsK/SpoIIIE domain-containing protein n=1 Tax=Mangrovactinospora gilvigrisea TaxID=1428644 RepID=UPI003012F324
MRDLVIDAPEGATVGDVAVQLAGMIDGNRQPAQRGFGPPSASFAGLMAQAATPGGDSVGTLWANGNALPADRPVQQALLDGQLVCLDPRLAPATRLTEPQGVVDLRVVGGPGAGLVARLPLGVATVGSAPGCTVRIEDPSLPPTSLRIEVAPDAVRVAPVPGAVAALEGTGLDSAAPTDWRVGEVVTVGTSLLSVYPPSVPDAFLSASDDGGLAFNRPPRVSSYSPGKAVVQPRLSDPPEGARLMLAASFAPMIMGVAAWYFFKSAYMLLFCGLTPLMMLAEYFSESRYGKKKRRKEVKKYQKDLAEYERQLEYLRIQDRAERREGYPDPAQTLLVATGPRRRLWERRLDDEDALILRVGSADQPAGIKIHVADRSDEAPVPPTVESAPVCIELAKAGVVGLAGARESMGGLMRWLVAQSCVLQSPRDLSLVLLAPGPQAEADWNWFRWLPHARPRQGQQCRALLGNDGESVGRRVAELVAEIDRRMSVRQSGGGMVSALNRDPAILVVLDGAQTLRRVPGLPQLLIDGPKVGVYSLCLDREERLLPEECSVVVSDDRAAPGTVVLRGAGLDRLGRVVADQVTVAWCDRTARALAPVRDISRDEADSALPTSARLLDLLGMPDPDADQVLQRWAHTGGRTTCVPLGYGPDGVFELDISRDGPHALVAGTTGAGKSELLQSLITSLAAANDPEALNFVLIDYKGGSAFQDCANLPHTVGMVSDLDAHLTERALESLGAELRRRERLLFDAEAKDIEDYWDTKALRPELEPIPRLVLIIDEFASLVAELPDFVAGLVDIARRGRSLGVHLVLATQRPAGVVSAEIRANTNLRISLRVTSPDESNDVIDAPDAALIGKSTPGRCYVRSGASALRPVQTARIGGRRPTTTAAVPVSDVSPAGWRDLAYPPPPRPEAKGSGADLTTDMAVLVAAIADAAVRQGKSEQRRPWLPPLPDCVTVDELADSGAPAAGVPSTGTSVAANLPEVPYGLLDLPAQQAQVPLTFAASGTGHLLIAGSPRSGRTTALRTLAGSLASRLSPADLHVYALDCGSSGLLPLVGLPHCGAVVTRDQTDRVERLLARLQAEVSRRQQLLAAEGFSSVAEQRRAAAPEDRLPWMLLMLDLWEGFHTVFESYDFGRLVDDVLRLLREGAAAGLHAVVTSDKSGLGGRISSVFEERLLLRMSNPDDMAMGGVAPRSIPNNMPDGRTLRVAARGVLEAQFALLDADPSGMAQTSAVQAIGRAATELHARPVPAQRPMRVDALPPRIGYEEMLGLGDQVAPASPLWVALGAGGDELLPQGFDLMDEVPGVVIAGPPRSGRSTALMAVARQLLGRGVPVLAVSPRRSPLRELAGREGVLGVLSADSTALDIDQALEGHDRYVVLVDDAELLQEHEMADRLEELVQAAQDAEQGMVVAGAADVLTSQYRGFVVQARRSKAGLLLAPGGNEGELFDIRLPRNAGSGPAGRGILVRGGQLMGVQVPVG